MRVSVIIPCKKRLQHLKQSLPFVRDQQYEAEIEIIVVDYNCPDKTAEWVEQEYGESVKTVIADVEEGEWSLSAARNLGFSNSTGDIILFLDADALLTDPNFISRHVKHCVEGSFICGWGYHDATGCCMIWRSAFIATGGYNEMIKSWGAEDIKLYETCEKVLCIERRVWLGGIETIKHGDEIRNEFHGGRDPMKTNEENFRIKEFKGL